MTPAMAPKSSRGRNCRAVTSPSAVPLPVSFSTSQAWATFCMNEPAIEIDWPVK